MSQRPNTISLLDMKRAENMASNILDSVGTLQQTRQTFVRHDDGVAAVLLFEFGWFAVLFAAVLFTAVLFTAVWVSLFVSVFVSSPC